MRAYLILFWHENYGTVEDNFYMYQRLMSGESIEQIVKDLHWEKEKQVTFIKDGQNETVIHNIVALYETRDIKLMTIVDEQYPDALRQMNVPPCVFCLKGKAEWLQQKRLGIFGNEPLSISGAKIVEEYLLPLRDTIIVGSLSMSLSILLFEQCIYQQKKGLCILTTNIERCMPLKQMFLQRRLTENHLVISELPLSQKHVELTWTRHVELLVGFSSCVCVVETTKHTLSMLAALEAVNQSKDVLVPPVSLFQPYGEGNHLLLTYGANLLISKQDIEDCLSQSRT